MINLDSILIVGDRGMLARRVGDHFMALIFRIVI